jgi:hypothetical protein
MDLRLSVDCLPRSSGKMVMSAIVKKNQRSKIKELRIWLPLLLICCPASASSRALLLSTPSQIACIWTSRIDKKGGPTLEIVASPVAKTSSNKDRSQQPLRKEARTLLTSKRAQMAKFSQALT